MKQVKKVYILAPTDLQLETARALLDRAFAVGTLSETKKRLIWNDIVNAEYSHIQSMGYRFYPKEFKKIQIEAALPPKKDNHYAIEFIFAYAGSELDPSLLEDHR